MKDAKPLQKRIDARMTELIESGILMEEQGRNRLHEKILKEFNHRLDKRSLGKKIRRLIWSNKIVDEALQQTVRWALSLEEFSRHYPYIPPDIVERRAAYHHGITKKSKLPTGETLPGIGRIDLSQNVEALQDFKMPKHAFKSPVIVETQSAENWKIMFLNGANIGTVHGGDIIGNIPRQALSYADKKGIDAVVLTNILCLDLKKAGGPPMIRRSHVFADEISPDFIKDPAYRKEVERLLAEKSRTELIYQLTEELLDNVLSGWTKISLKPNHRPQYRGPIYVVLGENENNLIDTFTYWEIKWWTVRKQLELKFKLGSAEIAKKAAEKREDFETAEDLTEEIKNLQAQYERTRMTLVATEEKHRYYKLARAAVIKKIEEAIPNSRVIGQDLSYLQVKEKKIEIYIPSHSRVSDRLLTDYALRYGPKNLKGGLADAVVICHAAALQYRMTVREADYDGKRGSSKIFVAPIAIDGDFWREKLEPSVAKSHPLAKAVFNEGFNPGVLVLSCINSAIIDDVSSPESLGAFKQYPKRKDSYRWGPKYIWFMFCADPHWGGRAKEFVLSKELKRRLGMGDAVFQMMRRDGLFEDDNMPVHIWGSPDDQTQGQNFPARTQPHPNQMPYLLAEYLANEMQHKVEKARNLKEAIRNSEKMKSHLLYQLEVRGTDFLLDQVMEMMERDIELNVDAYSAILRRFKKSGLCLKGVGEFVNKEYQGFDTRNCGAINFGSGNHFEHTVEGEIVEGPFYAKHLRALLGQESRWRDQREEIKKLVAAPLYSGKSIGWSIIQMPGGHEYGFEFRNKPTRMSGWGDTLLGTSKNFPSRGNYTRIFNGRLPILSVCGDKHFFGAVLTDYALHHMCASGTHTDRYGEEGFPPNNTGVSFVGLPTDGPDSGPILIRTLPFDVIKDYVGDNPRSFDWEAFLPNPA